LKQSLNIRQLSNQIPGPVIDFFSAPSARNGGCVRLSQFVYTFEHYFPKEHHGHVSSLFEEKFVRSFYDPCFDVEGMTSIKKQFLLKIAFASIEDGECYLEIGTYQGKSLISAVKDNLPRSTYACDNFSEFSSTNSLERLKENLKKHGLSDKIQVFDSDFRAIMTRSHIHQSIGCYFYDGAHDFESQYLAIKMAEPLFSDHTLVIIDDWRFASDSQSYAKEGTLKAISESQRIWNQFYELPARFNGDHGMWWNGIAVFASEIAKKPSF
jgi:predicted O-methyltransferase YrrM